MWDLPGMPVLYSSNSSVLYIVVLKFSPRMVVKFNLLGGQENIYIPPRTWGLHSGGPRGPPLFSTTIKHGWQNPQQQHAVIWLRKNMSWVYLSNTGGSLVLEIRESFVRRWRSNLFDFFFERALLGEVIKLSIVYLRANSTQLSSAMPGSTPTAVYSYLRRISHIMELYEYN